MQWEVKKRVLREQEAVSKIEAALATCTATVTTA